MKTILLATAVLAVAACAGTPDKATPSQAASDALYRALGGTPGITRVVDTFFRELDADTRINALFRNVDHADLRRLVIEQLCAASGGPCRYTGRSMEDAHSGLNLSNAEFDAFVGDLSQAMHQQHVSDDSQRKLLALLAPMRPQVVGQ
ncbi:MAG: group 1 truncated hemoglobin [Rudaea sp.]